MFGPHLFHALLVTNVHRMLCEGNQLLPELLAVPSMSIYVDRMPLHDSFSAATPCHYACRCVTIAMQLKI